MSAETTKAERRRKHDPLFIQRCKGKVIDIGAGLDLLKKEIYPNIESVTGFDLAEGDANKIDEYFPENHFDTCHSSQLLEHLFDPIDALRRMVKITKSGGYIIASFPDIRLYENYYYPSRYNGDHKSLFSINEHVNHPKFYNVIDMLREIEGVNIIKVELIDTDFDYAFLGEKHYDQTREATREAFIEIILQKR